MFLKRQHLQHRCLSPSVLLLPYSGMWGSLIPAKTRSSTVHSASTEGPLVDDMVGSWGQRHKTHAPAHLHPPKPNHITMILGLEINIQWMLMVLFSGH